MKPTYMRHSALPRLLATAATVAMGVCVAQAQACDRSGQSANFIVDQELNNDQRPGVMLSGWIGLVSANIANVQGCSAPTLAVDVNPSFSGLMPVGQITYAGTDYTTYALSATSPLIIIRHTSYPGPGGTGFHHTPVVVGTRTSHESVPMGTANALNSVFSVAFVSRGGGMHGGSHNLGTASTWVRQSPSLVMQHPLNITVRMRASTCVMSSASATLQDVAAADLKQPDDHAGMRGIGVAIACPYAGIPVKLSLADANDAGNTGSRLAPTANTTAGGVRVQLLRNDVPVVLGQTWDHGLSPSTQHGVVLQARYIREAGNLVPGVVEGQAIITATYR